MIRAVIFLAAVSAALAGSLSTRVGVKANTGPRDEPISTNPPNLPGGTIANDAPPGPFFKDFKPPFPTDSWWSGFTVGNQDATVAGPFPFQARTSNEGLLFGMSDTRDFDGTSIHVNTQLDWLLSLGGLPVELGNRKATSWDTQTVCLKYTAGASTVDTCLVPGSPYMTFTFTNAVVSIKSNLGDITSFQWINQGTKAKVTNNGGTYIIYVVGGTIDLTSDGKALTSPAGFSGTIRFAKLKEPAQEAILDQYANTYATGLTMGYTIQGDVATTTWTWDVVGNAADLLILSWPHHRKSLQAPKNVNIQYLTAKGQMKGVSGNVWTHRHELPTISWFPANDPHASCLSELVKTLEADINNLEVMIPGDFYFWGGAFGRAAQLATIAEHVGREDLIPKVLAILKESVSHWFEANRVPSAAYETGWGGFINKDGWNNTWVDFGNAYYNDHHFHYGYILHGAAVIGKYDPAWLNENLDFFMQCARGIGNPSPNDPHYTVTRHLDFFAGHSWASGIANGAGPRDQESSGEAINGYYGLLLFATAVKNQALIDYSRLILAYEIAGAQAYWHLYPKGNNPLGEEPYPEQGLRDLVTIGNVMDTSAGAWLFWGGQRIQIAAIQILPLTPIGQYTFDKEWMEEVLPYCKVEIDDPTYGDDFKSVILAAYATVNPQVAAQYSANLFEWGSGNSATNQLYFVATQPSATNICSAAAQTPEGVYNIQDVATGNFVTVGANGFLAATTPVSVLATKFNLAFRPGGGTIQAANGKFVTASPEGNGGLAATRDTAQGYETFRWAQQGDAYELTAMVNKQQVSTTAVDGTLQNNAGTTTGVTPSKYKLIKADGAAVPPPAAGTLKSVQSGNFAVSTAADPVLRVTGGAGEATRFAFAKVAADSPYYTIQNTVTSQYVTGDAAGTAPLSATRAEPQAWEYFEIVGYEGNFIISHVASGLASALQPDNTIIDNNKNIDNSARWTIA